MDLSHRYAQRFYRIPTEREKKVMDFVMQQVGSTIRPMESELLFSGGDTSEEKVAKLQTIRDVIRALGL